MESSQKVTNKRKLDTSDATQSLWLLKIPESVAAKWSSAKADETLGALKMTTIPPQSAGRPSTYRLDVQLLDDNNESGDKTYTDEYTLDEVPLGPQLVAFEFDKNEHKFSVKGKVSKRYNLKPRSTEQYQQVLRNRYVASEKRHQSREVADKDLVVLSNFESRSVDFIPPPYVDAKRREESGSNKRVKPVVSDEKEIRQRMIEAFASTEYLTFKQINTVCRASEADLREVLRKYADYHSKGPLKNYYALKPQYRGATT
mmetsp:Transcript_15328/g.23080  ORF Transcript_15328/g.23080 Transcript_15328/m.23080 type:complete len:258 (-) Transcript_15328:156-929(-)